MLSTADETVVVANSQVIKPFTSWILYNPFCENGVYLVIFLEPGNGTSGFGLSFVYGEDADTAEIKR